LGNVVFVIIQPVTKGSTLQVGLGTLNAFSVIYAMNLSSMTHTAYMTGMPFMKRACITPILRDALFAAEFLQDHTLLKH
jgi:hypothetical protein